MNFHCEFSSRFHSDSKRIRSGFESKRRESPRIHNVFAQQYGFANFGRVFTVIRCETLSWGVARERRQSLKHGHSIYEPRSLGRYTLSTGGVPASTRLNNFDFTVLALINGHLRERT